MSLTQTSLDRYELAPFHVGLINISVYSKSKNNKEVHSKLKIGWGPKPYYNI